MEDTQDYNSNKEFDIEVKGWIRDFFNKRFGVAKSQCAPFRVVPAILIREEELERFVDDLWVHMQVSLRDTTNDKRQ